MRKDGESKQAYVGRRLVEGRALGLNFPDSHMQAIFESDHDLSLLVEWSKLPEFDLHDAFIAMELGHGKYEMEKYGPVVVKCYTAVELAQSTIRPLTLKRFLSIFDDYGFWEKNKPNIRLFERLENAGITTASSYRKTCRKIGLDPRLFSNIHKVLSLVENQQIPKFWLEDSKGKP